ncbi:hypothetical protein [Streptomyces sp. 2A115]|uniref:hypothetical protein n=1 Tax=Streptomyces sp. 2A115 TaxID=3457439 RepID=UPI003FD48DF4
MDSATSDATSAATSAATSEAPPPLDCDARSRDAKSPQAATKQYAPQVAAFVQELAQ